MDDEQKQNLVKKGMHNTEANFDQLNIVTYDRREGFLPVWWHNVYGTRSTTHPWPEHIPLPEESSATTTQNVASNNSAAMASYGPNTMATQTVHNMTSSYGPMPRTSDAGTSNQSRNMQTEANVKAPTDTSLPNPKTCDSGFSSQSSS